MITALVSLVSVCIRRDNRIKRLLTLLYKSNGGRRGSDARRARVARKLVGEEINEKELKGMFPLNSFAICQLEN